MRQEPKAAPGLGRRLIIRLFGPGTWRNGLAWTALIVGLLAVRWALVDQFTIPSGSMEPTLHGDPRPLQGDRVSINKWVYGLRWPLNDWRVPFTPWTLHYADRRLFEGAKPKRWDIVVFKSAEEASAGETLIKRVVGLPGEHVFIGTDGRIQINGEPVDPPEELADVLDYTRAPTMTDIRRFVVYLARTGKFPETDDPDAPVWKRFVADVLELGRKLEERGTANPTENQLRVLCTHVAEDSWHVAAAMVDASAARQGLFRYGVIDEPAFTQVPAGHYYLLGDNSGNSRDGRAFGWVPCEHLLGRAFSIWWPPDRWRDLTGFTDRWWGRLLALLYGLPLVFVVYELVRFYVISPHRVPADWPEAGLKKGAWVWAKRWPFGVRLPFSFVRMAPGRLPARGAVVLYAEAPHAGYQARLLLGRVAAVSGEALADDKETDAAVIPPKHCGILGVPGQPDSRIFGPVPNRRIVGLIRKA